MAHGADMVVESRSMSDDVLFTPELYGDYSIWIAILIKVILAFIVIVHVCLHKVFS